ncbi:hypothetical protein AAG906_020947 [Vitis piasezkii]
MSEMGADQEGIDGVRMTWNVWPRTKVEASKCVIPIAASVSPIRSHPDIPTLPYAPLRCKTCISLLNPFCRVDFAAKIWICPFCFQRNHFPHHYSMISESNLPGELYPQYTTVEYSLSNPGAVPDVAAPQSIPPVFLFVLDTCMIEEELGFVKSALKRAIGLLPENALVGFVSFGTQVQVHELGFSEISKVYVFRGSKEISRTRFWSNWGSAAPGGGRWVGTRRGCRMGMRVRGLRGFYCRRRTASILLIRWGFWNYAPGFLLDELQTDQWPVQPGHRALRCTGVALSVAAGLLGACLPGTGARIIALVGGPCTEGPGTIVSKDLSDPVRSHKDLDKDAAPYFKKAVQFYENIAKQMVSQGHVLDLFASALDQVGVAEMKVVVERTGGLVVLAESFGHSVFKDSFKRIFEEGEQSLGLSFNGTLEINCSKDIKIQGIIGPCTSLEKDLLLLIQSLERSTTSWKMCGLDKTTCLTVFFDISSSERSNPPGTSNPQLYLQFIVSYQNPEGQTRLRVTTVTRRWVDSAVSSEELVQGFDQETAAVVMARLTSLKMETEEGFDATRWLDRSLIRLCSKFGDYRKDDPASFTLNPCFHCSSVYPSLISYSFNSLPAPALLDVASISADRILLLDSYFSVVIFHGMTIAQWRNMGYQNQPEHQAFAQLLQAPQDDAKLIIHDRFPVPRLVVCDQHGSQARFLLAKLNPSATYNNAHEMATGSDVIFTDDVSLQVFFEHLQRLAVQS